MTEPRPTWPASYEEFKKFEPASITALFDRKDAGLLRPAWLANAGPLDEPGRLLPQDEREAGRLRQNTLAWCGPRTWFDGSPIKNIAPQRRRGRRDEEIIHSV
jgi:hypothetical protein